MFPVDPLDEEAKWQCEICGREVTGRKAALVQSSLGRLLGAVDCKNAVHMERFLQEHYQIVPLSNQIIVEVKCCIIRIYGHNSGYMWTGEAHVLLFILRITVSGVPTRPR